MTNVLQHALEDESQSSGTDPAFTTTGYASLPVSSPNSMTILALLPIVRTEHASIDTRTPFLSNGAGTPGIYLLNISGNSSASHASSNRPIPFLHVVASLRIQFDKAILSIPAITAAHGVRSAQFQFEPDRNVGQPSLKRHDTHAQPVPSVPYS